MKQGFIKVAAGTVDVTVADTYSNAEKIIERIKEADKAGVNLLVLPELCLTGCSCGDLFLNDALIDSVEPALVHILEETKELYPITVFGMPLRYKGKLFNCAAVISQGEILCFATKNISCTSQETRYFTSDLKLDGDYEGHIFANIAQKHICFGRGLVFECDELRDFRFAVELGDEGLGRNPASDELTRTGACIICNPASPLALVENREYRKSMISALSSRLVCGYVSAGASPTESTGDSVYSRHHLIAENGKILAENAPFEENGLIITEIDIKMLFTERQKRDDFPFATGKTFEIYKHKIKTTKLTRKYDKNPFIPDSVTDFSARAEEILKIQSYGLEKRIEHAHGSTAVIGISGGLDSTLALLVTVRAFDLIGKSRKDIVCVTMPCFGTTKRTKSNAILLCEELEVTIREVNIKASVAQHFEDIGQDPSKLDVTYENAQARERTQVLMDIANMTNGLVIGTGDISELALGWATYNGDHMSMYGVNSSLPKTLIRRIVGYEADRLGGKASYVLYDILDTPVSPELLPAKENGEIAQKTEDLVGPYELHDFFLYYTVRYGFSPAKIFRIAKYSFNNDYSPETIMKCLKTFTRRFFIQQFKRSCLPDGPKVGSVSLSPRGDLCMPSDASFSVWMRELDEIEI